MKTVAVEKLSIISEYLYRADLRETDNTTLQSGVSDLKECIVKLAKRKEDVYDELIDTCIYELSFLLKSFETLLEEAESIRQEGGMA